MPTDRSVEDEKKALRQAATKARLKNLRMGKNPITGKTESRRQQILNQTRAATGAQATDRERSAIEKLREKLTPEILKKAAKR